MFANSVSVLSVSNVVLTTPRCLLAISPEVTLLNISVAFTKPLPFKELFVFAKKFATLLKICCDLPVTFFLFSLNSSNAKAIASSIISD